MISGPGVIVTTTEKAARVYDGFATPKIIREVSPEYPLSARSVRVQGTVTLTVRVGKDGTVRDALIRGHVVPLDNVALAAVKQWRFEPPLFNGAPVEFVFTARMTFAADQPVVKLAMGSAGIPLDAANDFDAPKPITRVTPAYPTAAQKAGVTGMVILEVVLDKNGKVKSVTVLRHAAALEQAAVEAVRQWQYEPARLNGVPADVVFTAEIVFSL